MSDDTIWIRIPRETFDDLRCILVDAATDLEHAARRNPLDPAYRGTAARARLMHGHLADTARGVLINETDAA